MCHFQMVEIFRYRVIYYSILLAYNGLKACRRGIKELLNEYFNFSH